MRTLLLFGAVLIVATLALAGCGGEDPSASEPAGASGRESTDGRALDDETFPPSLEGKPVPGGLGADASGRFVPSPEALRLFDFYLAARGEMSDAWVGAQVRREIEARLPEPAWAAALALFENYVGYLEAEAELEADGPEPDDMERHLARQRELRETTFGAGTAVLLFRDQERIDRVAIERRRVLNDPGLDARERIRRLAELQSELPEEVQRSEAEAYANLRLAREEERLRAEGASEAEIQALHEQDAAAQGDSDPESLERSQQAWSLRMKEYRAERDRVLEHVRSAPEEAKAVFLRRVRERYFEPDEIPRVEALDRIELRDRSLGNAPIPSSP